MFLNRRYAIDQHFLCHGYWDLNERIAWAMIMLWDAFLFLSQ